MDAPADFSGTRLSFDVSGAGVAVDPASGRLSIAADRLDGLAVTVTATDAAGRATHRFRLTAAAVAIERAPVLVAAPALAGTGAAGTAVIGTAVGLDPGAWEGTPAPELAVAWLRDGAEIAGATGLVYVPLPADDGHALAARVTATNVAGVAVAETAAVAVVHAVPTVVPAAAGGLGPVVADAGGVAVAVAAAAAFAGQALTFSVSGRGATIDSATGVVTIATDTLLDDERITVTATNSGGSAETSFAATVRATLPACTAAPALVATAAGGRGEIGVPVTVDLGAWAGVPAPELAVAWLRDGAEIAGATGLGYTPAAADDGRALSARVTATNPAGSVSAVTAALAVVHAAPVATGGLDDVALFVGDADRVVDAAAAFAGDALVFSVTGGGASVDAAGRVSVPATAAGSATVTVTATNSGGSATLGFVATVAVRIVPPLLVLAPVLAGTGRIGEPVTVSDGGWSGVPAPTTRIAWLRDGVEIPGATAASYTPVAADDRRALAARVTATNAGGSAGTVTAALSVTFAPPAVAGEIYDEIFDLGSGVQTVAAAPAFAGDGLAFAVSGANATVDAATGVVSIPTDAAVQSLVTVTATNSGGSASLAFAVTVEAEDVPFALEAEDVEIVELVWRPAAQETWFSPRLRLPGLAGEEVAALEWTTAADPVPESQFEPAVPVGAGVWALYMRDPAKNAPGAKPRVDYSVWKAGEARLGALRLRWKRSAEDPGSAPWSAPGVALAVPLPGPTRWLPLLHRTEAQFDEQIAGGGGFQFFRSWGYSPAKPDRLIGAMDIDIPIRTDSFGDWWEPAPSLGLKVAISGQGCAIDSQDGDRVLVMYSAASRRFLKGWNDQQGIYLSTDGGASFALVQQLDDIAGSGEGANDPQPMSRFMQFPFLEVPGGTPDTRRWYAFQRKVPKGKAPLDGALWTSADGGRSWAVTGEALTIEKFGHKLCVLRRATNGDFYLGTGEGLFRSTDAGGSWTKLASLPAGGVLEVDVRGAAGEIWACVDGVGLFRSADHGASWSRRKQDYDIKTFAISPHDRARILIAGARTPKRMVPQISTDGGASWTEVATEPFPGQPEPFHSYIHDTHAYFIFHATDPAKVFAARYQHLGRSTDGGKTFVWASNDFDYNCVYDIAVDPTDWRQMALVMQDRMLVFTENGHDWVREDAVDAAVKAEVSRQGGFGGSPDSGRGALILRNGDHRRIITGVGNGARQVTVVHSAKGGNPIGQCMVPDHGGNIAWCVAGSPDAADTAVGYIGRWRYELGPDGTLAGPIDIGYEAIGVGNAGGVVFGVEKSSGDTIWRSTDHGATWAAWATAPEPFRPIDARPVLSVDRSSPGRMLALCASGAAYLLEGERAPAIRKVFDLRSQIGPGYPGYELLHGALDPRDPNVAYVSGNVYGGGSVFRTRNLGDAVPAWEDVSGNGPRQPRFLFVHPATGELISSYHHGSMILPAVPGGQRAALEATGTSLYARVGAFPGLR